MCKWSGYKDDDFTLEPRQNLPHNVAKDFLRTNGLRLVIWTVQLEDGQLEVSWVQLLNNDENVGSNPQRLSTLTLGIIWDFQFESDVLHLSPRIFVNLSVWAVGLLVVIGPAFFSGLLIAQRIPVIVLANIFLHSLLIF